MTPASGDTDSASTASASRYLERFGWPLLFLLTITIAAQYIWQFSVSRDISWDEGYLMITMRGFLDGHALYDEVFTQYGPAYYLLRAPLFGWFGVPLDHNWTRLLCMLIWVGAAAMLAYAMWRVTGSRLFCWLTVLQAVVHLTDLGNEPGHPQELVALLLALIVLVLAVVRSERRAWYAIAVIVALLTMIKINVGVFALLGIGLVHVSTLRRWPASVLVMLAMLLGGIPIALMWRHLGESWAATYAVVAAATIIASSLCLLQQQRHRSLAIGPIPLKGFILAFSGVVAASLAGAMVHGTSLPGLVDGLLLAPLRLADVYVLPLKAKPWSILNAVAAAIFAAVYCWQFGNGKATRWIGLCKLVFGVAGSLLLAAAYERQLQFLAPWLWLMLVPPNAADQNVAKRPSDTLRVAVAAIAAFQLLQAYPVAGSQLAWSTLLLIVAYTLCLYDVIQMYRLQLGKLAARLSMLARGYFPAVASAIGSVLVLSIYVTFWMELPRLRAHYATVAPLQVHGATLVRLSPSLNSFYLTLIDYLKADSDTFVTYPGFHSLYLLTDIAPPTHYNVTVWDLLSDAQQTAIVEALGRHTRPRIVLVRDPRDYWRSLDPAMLRPFERLVLEEYEDAAVIGPTKILAPRRDGLPGSTSIQAGAIPLQPK